MGKELVNVCSVYSICLVRWASCELRKFWILHHKTSLLNTHSHPSGCYLYGYKCSWMGPLLVIKKSLHNINSLSNVFEETFFLKWANPGLKNVHPVNGLGNHTQEPSEHESPPITTRPLFYLVLPVYGLGIQTQEPSEHESPPITTTPFFYLILT